MNAKEYIKYLLSVEDYSFSLEEISMATDGRGASLKFELIRLVKKGEIVNLRKGFYLIIPPKYSSAKKLPIHLYSAKLFKFLKRNYYIALFSAAKFHGIVQQQVPRDYFITERPKYKDISKNTFEILFFTTNYWSEKNIQTKKTDSSVYKISGPALTIVDLIHHQSKLGGIKHMLSTIEELAEQLTESDLLELLKWYPNKSTLQRFGFILEKLGSNRNIQEILFELLNPSKIFPVLLNQKSGERPGTVDNRWKIVENVQL